MCRLGFHKYPRHWSGPFKASAPYCGQLLEKRCLRCHWIKRRALNGGHDGSW